MKSPPKFQAVVRMPRSCLKGHRSGENLLNLWSHHKKNDGWEALITANHRGPKILILWNKRSLQENAMQVKMTRLPFAVRCSDLAQHMHPSSLPQSLGCQLGLTSKGPFSFAEYLV